MRLLRVRPVFYLYLLCFLTISYGIARLYPRGVFYLDGDGVRYTQIALQWLQNGRLALAPEFDKDISVIYPPLLPAAIALLSWPAGDSYAAAHWVIYLCLVAVTLLAALLVRLVFKADFAALFAAGAAAVYMAPRNARSVMTEPLMAVLTLLAFILFYLGIRSHEHTGQKRYVALLGVVCCMATLCRQAGAFLLPSFIIAAFAAFPEKPRLAWRTLGRPLLIWSVVAVSLYAAYHGYMRYKGNFPTEVLVYSHSLVWHGNPQYWPPFQYDPATFRVSLKPERASLTVMIWRAPHLYLRTAAKTVGAIFPSPVVVLLLLHVLHLVCMRNKRVPELIALDVGLLTLFGLNADLVCLVGQHPNYVPRMFDPWVVCSVSVLAGEISLYLRSIPLERTTRLWAGALVAFICMPLPLAVYGYVSDPKHSPAGAVAVDVVRKLREAVPPGQIIITPTMGGPEISAIIAGYLNMHFIGPEDTYLKQMKAHRLRYALWANEVKIDYDRVFPGCATIFDLPFHRLLSCPTDR